MMDNEEMNNVPIEEDSNIVTLTDEDGHDVNFEFLDLIDYQGETYAILLPAEDVEQGNSDEVVILREDKNEKDNEADEETYVSVDDEEILNKVFEIFKDKFKDEFNFVEDEN